MKNQRNAAACLRLVGGVAILLSVGCTIDLDDHKDREQNCDDRERIPEVVEQDFFASDSCAAVDYMVVVREGTLEVEAGTTLLFQEGGGIHIEEDGNLWAQGTEDEGILFSGEKDTPGFWKGVYFEGSMSRDNVLEYLTVEYGGGGVWEGEEPLGPANISIWNSRVDMANFTLQKSEGYGLHLGGDSEVRISGANEIIENNGEPVRAAPNLVGVLTAETTFAGNESDFILVTAGTIEDDATWEEFDVPIAIAGRIIIDADLSIDGGNELVFQEGGEMEIDDGDEDRDDEGDGDEGRDEEDEDRYN